MTKIVYFALKIKGGGREGGTCEVLRPCHPLKIWNVHQRRHYQLSSWITSCIPALIYLLHIILQSFLIGGHDHGAVTFSEAI